MGLPPSSGADHDTATSPSPGATLTPVGVDGAVTIGPENVVEPLPVPPGEPTVVDVVDDTAEPGLTPLASAGTSEPPPGHGGDWISEDPAPGVGPTPAGRATWVAAGPAVTCDGVARAPVVTAPLTTSDAVPTRPSTATVADRVEGYCPTNGSEPSHANGPASGRSRPMETSRKARTTLGSNWVPAQAANSARAALGLIDAL